MNKPCRHLGESIPDRGDSKCKGAEVALASVQNSDKASVDNGVTEDRTEGDEVETQPLRSTLCPPALSETPSSHPLNNSAASPLFLVCTLAAGNLSSTWQLEQSFINRYDTP